jgi:hypothetical protein
MTAFTVLSALALLAVSAAVAYQVRAARAKPRPAGRVTRVMAAVRRAA